ncbi:hypothetical protein GCM10017044_12670 [Kordiimonas sediminis]|uniref:Methyltransferase domain-containing protein n=1 Tax=Kordiimonas sediminis TaxID=1735581 RepID=A0A919E703_9PROT|nr:class I SAM-dependent methyltransferase [Kordiimonas sediminis]GHF19478.1 hypothetical protein GCM10017044_12670 [Kordiimonas sediminis]
MTSETCDACNSSNLSFVYEAPTTTRGLKVYLCETCGLLQSLPRIDHEPNRKSGYAASGAGFGNIRYGKGFRTAFAIETLQNFIDLKNVRAVLDIGSNRGDFLTTFLKINPTCEFVAVEPDNRVLSEYPTSSNLSVIIDRIENVELPANHFDLVYSCHTLEHVLSGRQTLEQTYASMKDGGIMCLEVPSIEVLNFTDVVEEFFMDKHLYHYSGEILTTLIKKVGFNILWGPEDADTTNLTILAQKVSGEISPTATFENAPLVAKTRAAVETYEKTLTRNLESLKSGAAKVTSLAQDKKVAIWGAGRIFSSLVEYGELDPHVLSAVVDKKLHALVKEVFGVKIDNTDTIGHIQPDIILIASRLYFEEIKSEATALSPNSEFLSLEDLLG